ncbi:MAG: shikimate kinase [Candidatus Hydrogenedentes bacterium]|nr:shikimate kinase [Candidatus Hydrogenedentota bacterium]
MATGLNSNIVLIGMPGVGKSTAGILLAKVLRRDFVDTDVQIQVRERRLLQDVIDTEGLDAFLAMEERHILAMSCRNSVIATGGSVVYSQPAMDHLRTGGIAIHLRLPLPALEKRLVDTKSRGLVITPGQSIAELYYERQPLYRRYADITVECNGLTHDQVVGRVLEEVKRQAL